MRLDHRENRPQLLRHCNGGGLLPQSKLVQLLDLLLVPTYGRYKGPSDPEVLAHEVLLALPVHPRQKNRTVAYGVSTYPTVQICGATALRLSSNEQQQSSGTSQLVSPRYQFVQAQAKAPGFA